MLKAILFDLDGTLLPMDQDTFVNAYFTEILKKFVPLGYDGKKLTKNLWEGTKAMIENDGKKLTKKFFGIYSKKIIKISTMKKSFLIASMKMNSMKSKNLVVMIPRQNLL